jgi:hypothetical protein
MTRTEKQVGAWVLAFTVAAGAALAASGYERSIAVYPPQRMPLRFDHGMHLKAGADCTSCHDAARKSPRAADLNLPRHPECEVCHDIQAARAGQETTPKSTCATCHPGFDETVHKVPARVDFPAPNLIFDHAKHVQKKVECTTCHGQMLDVVMATRNQLPKMATCLTCHDGRQASGECKTCHLTQPSGRLQIIFSSGMMRPTQGNPFGMDHGPRFEFNHGTRASLNRETCMECHAESDCQTCHDSLRKPLSVHPNDFITLHPLQARVDATKCESCHRRQSFCAACHERTGVGMDADRSFRARNAKVHPDYRTWVDDATSPQHHGIQASRNIQACIACHREESCMTCHANADRFPIRAAINPHPDGFLQACKAQAAKNDRPCLKCHSPATLASKGCR